MKVRVPISLLEKEGSAAALKYLADLRRIGVVDGDEIVVDEADNESLIESNRRAVFVAGITAHFQSRTDGHRAELQAWIDAGRPFRSSDEITRLQDVCNSCVDSICRQTLCAEYGRRMATWHCPMANW